MMTLFSEKALISNRCISGLMSNLIKKSWTDSTGYPVQSLFIGWSLTAFGPIILKSEERIWIGFPITWLFLSVENGSKKFTNPSRKRRKQQKKNKMKGWPKIPKSRKARKQRRVKTIPFMKKILAWWFDLIASNCQCAYYQNSKCYVCKYELQ